MNKPTQLVLIGASGAGKSTLCNILQKKIGWEYHNEVGRSVYEELIADNKIHSGEGIPSESDILISNLEIQRDYKFSCLDNRIIESWHPTNLAYAGIRGNLIKLEEDNVLKKILNICSRKKNHTFIQPLSVKPSTVSSRCNLGKGSMSSNDVLFYLEVYRRTIDWCERLQLQFLPEIQTDQVTPNLASEQIINNLITQNLL